jgi:hypothetical protein
MDRVHQSLRAVQVATFAPHINAFHGLPPEPSLSPNDPTQPYARCDRIGKPRF